MKKSIIISLVSLSLLIFLPKIASSAGTTVVSLNPASQSVNVGDTIAVTLRVDDAVDMDSMVVDILFDSTKITYDHVTISSDISSLNWTAEAFECAPASADCINLMVLSDMFNYVNGGANIATIYFTANGAGTNNFTYANNFARNPSFEDITSAWTPASVTINEVVLSNIATVTSATYTVGATTITNVPFATSKATFLAALAVGEANQTWVDTAIADPVVSGNTLVVTAQDGSTTITYTVTVNANPDIASVVADKAALVDDSIKGANSALSNVTVALTNPLPSTGANGSTITWVSNNTGVVSSNGQTINRPTFASGDATVTMTATITKGVVTDTKVFTLTVIKLPASSVATVTSATYTVSTGGSPNNKTITDIPFGTSKAVFLAALTKGETNQTWNSTSIADPVLTGNTLVVTAEDGATTKTYTVTVDPDSIAPVITVFTIPATADSLTISITSFTATDAVGITGYKLTEVNNYQGLNSGWTDTAPTSYTFNNEGSKTLYAWAKDAAGNVSAGASGSVVVTVAIIPLDADGDGVDDNSLDKCLGTPAGAVVNHRGCVKPNFEKFDIKPNTAVLDDIDPIDNLSNFEIGQSAYGKIVFAQPVNLFRNNEPLDLDSNIIFTDKKIELKSANLTELNTSATLTIYNVPYATPKILRDGVECAADVCAVLTYTGNTLVFTVTGFSIYEAVNGDTTAPSKPTGLGATANSSSQIALSWTASTDDIGPIVYNIFRNSTTTAAIATTTGTTYSDTGLSASTQYTYYVSAYDLAGNISEVSAGASATTGNVVTPPSGGGGGGGGGGSADYNAPTNVLVII
ncbi:MAG: hypothetical protein Q7K35_05010, partial [bacterium]|nr:hypothetical protein [bacterium]